MKRFMITLLCLLAAACPPIALLAQNLQMLMEGTNSSQVSLEDLRIDTKITGNIASTTWTMVFRNASDRMLEGELTFPLAEDITVSRYAIDINGRLRDAVPVDKAKGTTVLEAIEQRRIDPGLLERIEGNAFRTRVYPLPPRGIRTVVIGYEEVLYSRGNKLEYRLPLAFQSEVPKVTLSVSSFMSGKPETSRRSAAGLDFSRQGSMWTATKELGHFLSNQPLVVQIPQVKEPTVLMQAKDNRYYCLINIPPVSGSRERTIPNDITVLWDASLSGMHRNHEAELELLDGYLRRAANATVNLVVFSNTAQPLRSFTIKSGNWQLLRDALEQVVYDGGTQLGKIDMRKLPGREFLLFSDGLATYGPGTLITGPAPVYCVNSSAHADYPSLRYIAAKTGGELIDLSSTGKNAALEQLTNQPLKLLGIQAGEDVDEVYPNVPIVAEHGAGISAVTHAKQGKITLLYGYGTMITDDKTIEFDISNGIAEDADLSRMWAAQKIAALNRSYEKNRSAIENLGKRFGLVTRNTSLIVLETLDDYIRYDIVPPAELRESYDRIMKDRQQQRAVAVQGRITNAEAMFKSLINWWNPVADNQSGTPQASTIQASGTSGIKGVFKDEKGNPIVNANVVVLEGGIQKGRDLTDFDGNYTVRPLNGGRYDVDFSYLGRGVKITNVAVAADQIVTVNGKLGKAKDAIKGGKGVEVHAVRAYQPPIIDPENPGGRQVKVAEQIEKSGMRNTADIAALSTQVYQGGSSQSLSIGSGRGSGTKYVVDGVQLPPGTSFTNKVAGSLEAIASGVRARPGYASDGFIDEAAPLFGIGQGARQKRRVDAINEMRKAVAKLAQASDSALLDSITMMPDEDQYATYISLRQARLHDPSFYFQVAKHFFATHRKELGLKIASNLAELDVENYELYKMLGYKLRELGESDAALEAFRKVLVWRPMDPQSRRDYGLALADAGFYKDAVDTLYAALTMDIDPSLQSTNSGIEEVLLCDINGIITQHPDATSEAIPHALIKQLPADIRVVINWNTKSTDIDLMVTDPKGEVCHHGRNFTTSGGRLSQNITQGFGPEQFILRNVAAGKYKVEVSFRGDRQVKIAGPSTVMAEIYTGWEKTYQQRQIVVVQLKPTDRRGVLIGEFEFGRQL